MNIDMSITILGFVLSGAGIWLTWDVARRALNDQQLTRARRVHFWQRLEDFGNGKPEWVVEVANDGDDEVIDLTFLLGWDLRELKPGIVAPGTKYRHPVGGAPLNGFIAFRDSHGQCWLKTAGYGPTLKLTRRQFAWIHSRMPPFMPRTTAADAFVTVPRRPILWLYALPGGTRLGDPLRRLGQSRPRLHRVFEKHLHGA